MTSREDAARRDDEGRYSGNDEAEGSRALLVAVGVPVDSEVHSNSSSHEAIASTSSMEISNVATATLNQELYADQHDDRQRNECYAVPTVLEEEESEIVDLASTQMGTLEEGTASAAVIETRELEVDEEDSLTTRALKRAAYAGYDLTAGNENDEASHRTLSPPQATIVSIAEHEHEHEDHTLRAVHATLIGQDYAQARTNSFREASLDSEFSRNEAGRHDIAVDETAEATVIDSAPLQHQSDIPDWKVSGEARVMSDESSMSADQGLKMTANESESQASVRSGHRIDSASTAFAAAISDTEIGSEVAVASQEAEVLGFREIHPSEYPCETTQAELISQMSTFATAELSVIDGHCDHSDQVSGDTTIMSNETNNYNSIASDGVEYFPNASPQAEVLGIQENVHPNEFPNETEAHLIGELIETTVASESQCQAFLTTEQGSYDREVQEIGGVHLSDETNTHTVFFERNEDDQEQNAMLIGNECFAAPSNETEVILEHAEAILISSPHCLNQATASVPTSVVSSESIINVGYPDEAMVLPLATGVEADFGWPEKSSESHLTGSAPNDVFEALEPFQSPTRSTQYNHENEVPVSASSNVSDRSGGTFSSQRPAMQQITHSLARGTASVIENIFGDTKPPFGGRRRSGESNNAEAVVPRTLLPWSVILNPTTNMWTATIQTNQKALDRNDRMSIAEANKSLRAFVLPTEKAAVALARAWTPPRMKEKGPACHICSSRFALLRRPCHCRNCGVVICKECSVIWPSKMIPDTYNIKKENSVNICRSCDWLSSNFRLALLKGSQDRAVALHATGNINLHAPFGNVKGELLYPVHCAVLGGSLPLLKWLVDENCCPIKSLRLSGSRESAGSYTPIVTSKGRSLLGIALENRNVDIVRYLVVRKGISLASEQDITFEMLLRNLDRVLHLLPEDVDSSQQDENTIDLSSHNENVSLDPILRREFDEVQFRSISDEARDLGAVHRDTEMHDDCIICFDSKIDCVATPCGHQICCLKCSQQITRCPVCSSDCTFMRVFKP